MPCGLISYFITLQIRYIGFTPLLGFRSYHSHVWRLYQLASANINKKNFVLGSESALEVGVF
jgi:hypothetical protein